MLKTTLTLDKDFESLYRQMNRSETMRQLLSLSGIGREQIDVGIMSHEYFKDSWDTSNIDQNANSKNHCPINYGLETTKPQLKLIGFYLLHRYLRKELGLVRANNLIQNLVSGDYYFHDSSGVGIQIPYCIAVSTMWIMANGIPWGQLPSMPPKKAKSFIGQVAEVTMDMSQNFAGAVAPADVLVMYSYYAKNEGLSDKDIENDLQSLVHIFNKQFRPGGQSPFTNISIFDEPNLKHLFSDTVFFDGSKVDISEVMRIQRIFLHFFCKGDPSSGLPYRFPIVTVNFQTDSENKVKDRNTLKFISQVNTASGCLNIHSGNESKLAMCCRFTNDPKRMRLINADTFGNGGLNIGSHRVVAIDIPRIAYEARGDWKLFFSILEEKLCDVEDLLNVHRNRVLGKRVREGFLPLFDAGLVVMKSLFSTIGYTGMPEAMTSMGVKPEEYVERVKSVLLYMDSFAEEASVENAFNVEEIPGEGASLNLWKKDAILYPDQVSDHFYSNQFVPLSSDMDIADRIEINGKLMKYVSGGSILHLNISDQIKSSDIMEKLMRYTIESGVTHFAVNYGFNICENGHVVISSPTPECKVCGSTSMDHLTRIVGYFVPVSSWGGREEIDFKSRKWLSPPEDEL